MIYGSNKPYNLKSPNSISMFIDAGSPEIFSIKWTMSTTNSGDLIYFGVNSIILYKLRYFSLNVSQTKKQHICSFSDESGFQVICIKITKPIVFEINF